MIVRLINIALLLLVLSNSSICLAQKEGYVWCFGEGLGLDFNTGIPTPFTYTSMFAQEGTASISNPFGQLRFYTNGATVYNRLHQTMPNGTGLNGNLSSTQAALIVPKPGSTQEYYIMSTYQQEFHIVDMSANGGLGDVVLKNQVLTSSLEMQSAAKHADEENFWIVSCSGADISAFHLSDTGFSSTVVLTSGISTPSGMFATGTMKFNSANNRMLLAKPSQNMIELYDFDDSTGVFSNRIEVQGQGVWYAEFSPFGRYVYAVVDTTFPAGGSSSYIAQYDLSTYNQSAINSSKQRVSPFGVYRALQMAPDLKIYVAENKVGAIQLNKLGVINHPDSAGFACDFNPNFHTYPSNISLNWGLPNLPAALVFPSFLDSNSCANDTTFFKLTNTNFDSVSWFFYDSITGNTTSTNPFPTHVYSAPGFYDVRLIAFKQGVPDTNYRLIRIYPQPVADLGTDSIFCEGVDLTIQNADSTFDYLWSTGYQGMNLQINQPDTYWVKVSNLCGVERDTLVVDSITPALVKLPNDTLICAGDSLFLDATIYQGTYLWNTGNIQPFEIIQNSGLYRVTATNYCGSSTDSIQVDVLPLVSVSLGNDTSICPGTLLVLNAKDTAASYMWDNGTNHFERYIGLPGVYSVTVSNYCSSKTDTIQVGTLATPNLDLGPDTILCLGDDYVLTDSVLYGSFTWSTGEITDSIIINSSGSYFATVDNGCGTDTDTVQVWYDSSPLTELGPDATYCINQLITLDASHSRATYLWQNGSSDSAILADTSGNYWVEVTNLCGFDDDTVRIKYDVPISFTLGADTAICDNDSILLTAPAINAIYQWNTGNSDSLLYAKAGSTYSVKATNACGAFSDSITIDMLHTPLVDFPQGDTLCEGDLLIARVESSNANIILWNDGNTDNERKFRNSGTYTVSVTNNCGTVADSLTLFLTPNPNPELGSDTILCLGESFTLGVHNTSANYSYRWSGGETDSAITINEAAKYSVTVTSPYGCEGYDEIEVKACGTTLYIPTAFTPNGDGLNDEFKVEGTDITLFYIAIYNRWGNLVFESTDPTKTWNGTFQNQGEPVNAGIFTYVLWYASGQYQSEEISGSVTVVR